VPRVITLLLAIGMLPGLLAGCGGGERDEASLVDPEVLLDSAAAHPVRSADLEGQARLSLEGSSLLTEPVPLRFKGPYVSGEGVRIPSFDWKFDVELLGFGVDGQLVSTGRNVLISPFGDNYEVGTDAVAAVNREVAANSVPARELFDAPRNEGNEQVNGVDTQLVSAELDGKTVAQSLRPLRDALGLAHVPAPVGRIEAWIGVDDRTVRKLALDADFGIAPDDRQKLAGASGGSLDVEVVLDEINDPQSVRVPAGGGYKPIRDLLLTLQDLGAFAP
jgi:hypothetical protein